MIPSSRTPEGDHLRCYLCNAMTLIEPSRPPGDVTCPSCGTLNWVAGASESAIERTRRVIRSHAAEITKLVAANAPRAKLAKRLVEVLPICLAAHGATLWHCSRRHWWSRKRRVAVEYQFGLTARSKQFAERIANDSHHKSIRTEDNERDVLVIGVPIVVKEDTVAVIQVLQRLTANEATKRGFVRFTEQLAGMVAASEAFAS